MTSRRPAAINTAISRLGRDSGVYALIFGLQRIIGFLMLPVYTRYLTPADYGVMQLLSMTIDIGAILFTAGMSSGVQRFYVRATTEEQRRIVISTAFVIEIGLSAAGALLMIAFSTEISLVTHGGAGGEDLVRMAAANFFLSMLLAVPMIVLETQQRAGLVLLISAVKLLLQVSLNVIFVVWLDQGVRGILFSTFVSNAVVGGVLAAWLFSYVGVRLRRAVFWDLLRFGVPIQIVTAGSFTLAFGDRFFLLPNHGATAVGLYGLTFQFAFMLGQLSGQPFLSAWNPQRYQLATESGPTRDARQREGFLYFNVTLLVAATAICLGVRPVLELLTPTEFHAAADLVPVVVLAYLFQWWMLAVGFGLELTNKTRKLAEASTISLGVVLVLYARLIPEYGAPGAAFSTLLAFALRFLLVYRSAQRVAPITYDWGPALRLLGMGSAVVMLGRLVVFGSWVPDLTVAVMLFGAFAVGVWHFAFEKDHRLRARAFARATLRTRLLGGGTSA